MATSAITPPSKDVYGVFGPAYAARIAAGTGDPGADILNKMALQMLAQNEQGSYADLLQKANQGVLQQTNIEQQGGVAGHYIDQAAALSKAGVLRGTHINSPYVSIDPNVATQADQIHLNNDYQTGQKTAAEALKTDVEAGFRPSLAYVEANAAGPGSTSPVPMTEVPSSADQAALTSARASLISANNPKADPASKDSYIVAPGDALNPDPKVTLHTHDAARAAAFARQHGAADPNQNPRLQAVLKAAKQAGLAVTQSDNSTLAFTASNGQTKYRKIDAQGNPGPFQDKP